WRWNCRFSRTIGEGIRGGAVVRRSAILVLLAFWICQQDADGSRSPHGLRRHDGCEHHGNGDLVEKHLRSIGRTSSSRRTSSNALTAARYISSTGRYLMDGPVFPSPFPGNFGGPLRSSEYPNTVPCSPHCNDGETLQWESVFPQGNYSVGQGFVGQRVCSFKGTQPDLRDALRDIMATHWPEPMDWCPDCLPVNVQFGAAQNASPLGNIADADIGNMLEGFTQYRIFVTYQLLRISDPWPPFGKPDHPQGTILTLQVRGGGEILQIDPTALAGGNGLNLTGCYVGTEPAINNAFNSRIRIPLTEYHITCDRLTDAQLCSIMTYVPWKCREGTVNYEGDPESFGNPPFLGEREGTLMFDTWTLSPTYAPDVDNPRRWQLSCVLKCRQIPGVCGPYPSDCSSAKYPVGWNHDYKKGVKSGAFGWQFIMMHMPGN